MNTHPDVDQFFSRYPERTFDKGSLLLRPGDGDKAYYLTKGSVIQYDISEAGDKLVVNTYKEGAFISLLGILCETPVDFFFEARERVSARVAPSKGTAAFLRTHPDVAYETLERLVRGSDGLLHRLASMMAGGAELRILQELRIMQARFARPDHSVAVTMSELGAQTGLARETVSRALKKLRASGAITSSRGRITLSDKIDTL